MMKTIAVAALLAVAFAAPVSSVQAAPMMSDSANCLIFPVLKKECWDMAKDAAMAVPKAAGMAVASTASAATKVKLPVPLPLGCARAAAGSGHLFDCN